MDLHNLEKSPLKAQGGFGPPYPPASYGPETLCRQMQITCRTSRFPASIFYVFKRRLRKRTQQFLGILSELPPDQQGWC